MFGGNFKNIDSLDGIMNLEDALRDFGLPLGEHKHSGHEVVMSGAGNACPICQAFEIAALKAKVQELETKIAALNKEIEALQKLSN